jgi:type VI secretion system protein ImpL
VSAKFEMAGTVVSNPAPPPPPGLLDSLKGSPQLQPLSVSPVPVQWPGLTQSRIVTVAGGQQMENFTADGDWSLFKVLEKGGLSAVRGRTGTAHYVVPISSGQLALSYEVSATSTPNPLNLEDLRQFKCPSGI